MKCVKDLELLKDKNIENFMEFISDLGCMFKEMLKIKLYPPYSTIVLGILSRTHTILNYFNEKESKMMKNVDEILNAIIMPTIN